MMRHKIIFAVALVSAYIIFFVSTYFKNQSFSCPEPTDLYVLSKNPIYHGMSVNFDDQIKVSSAYNFMRTRVNFRFNHEWQCSYYSRQNSPVMVSMNEPAGGLDEVGDSWASYHGQYACDDAIDRCQVKKIKRPAKNPALNARVVE